jgi:hypothetical protein
MHKSMSIRLPTTLQYQFGHAKPPGENPSANEIVNSPRNREPAAALGD